MDNFLKPFYTTSEFWTMLFTVVINFLNIASVWDWASNWHSGILITIAVAAYNVARSQTKNGVLRGVEPAVVTRKV